MALRIDMNRKQLEHIIDTAIASSRRAINTSKRPEFEELYRKDIEQLLAAKNGITEIK